MARTPPHRQPLLTYGRVLALLLVLAALSVRTAPAVYAAITPPVKDCTGPDSANPKQATIGDAVNCKVKLTGLDTGVDFPDGTLIAMTAVGGNYNFTGFTSLECDKAAAVTATACVVTLAALDSVRVTCPGVVPTTPCAKEVRITELLTITAVGSGKIFQNIRVTPSVGAITDLLNITDPAFTIKPPGPAGTTFFVAPDGDDTRTCQLRASPCKTFTRALQVAHDRDTITALTGAVTGEFTITTTIKVTKLVTIAPDSGAKIILKASPGVTIFEVSAQGGPGLHVTISNFLMGGNFAKGSTAPVILLVNDNYTEIAGNILGGEDLAINNGIVMSNSDHTNIHDNVIQGTTQFVFAPLLVVGKTTSGFGIVTLECFGGSSFGVSDSATITSNLFTNQLISAIWMCSDGGGEHIIDKNTFRNNWRGIALKDVTNSKVSNNVLTDEKSDGIIVYGASLQNSIEHNQVESHVDVAAAGIRIGWIADPIVPLSNSVTSNILIRDTIGLHIFGARTTVVTQNEFKISGARTAILITPSTTPGDPGTQPFDTEITGNVIVFIGPCSPVIGCAIRLLGTTVPVLATNNDWGLRRASDVEGVIWHQVDDPVLGPVTFVPFKNQVQAPPPPPAATPPPEGAAPTLTPTPTTTTMPGAPTPTVTAASTTSSTSVFMPLPLDPGCASISWPGVSGISVVDAVMGINSTAAQRTAMVWRQDGDGWKAWGPGLASRTPRDVFTLNRGDRLQVCVDLTATWLIATQVGGP